MATVDVPDHVCLNVMKAHRRYLSHSFLRLKIFSAVPLSNLTPVCSSTMIVVAWGFSLLNRTIMMTLLAFMGEVSPQADGAIVFLRC